MLFLIFQFLSVVLLLIEFHPEMSRPTTVSGFAGRLGSGSLGKSTTNAFHDLGKPIASVGEAVEVVLALAAAVNDSTVP